ncbi:hypothetical protein AGABI1DRAFT_104904 [Agaricus bisporus var. burnettii JB137-S8]|uniref:DUF6533 domain-containing protein n=1 Tax=Agaricus bisporus var. burnettii (strain JB137-S8 / ATCC MYA-4627 / FGSC 10392) TaxID=597362 RepID=K5Y533_AGABU|nr:uncharacterized protein AGABI1DRAFT_104904 [Agaricus bisporus var. burnettii JB137-S8]EKM83175.1 hypothetical protein AGABI1DRAFT_104904 [Agaricus bisporus var. burnettii JB137-S8]
MLNTLFALTPQPIDGLNQLVWSKVYDWLITLDVEIQLVWQRSGWSHLKIAYLINRYLVIVDIIIIYSHSYITHPEACKPIFEGAGVLYLLGVIISEYITSLRVCVVWEMNKIIIAILISTLTTATIYVLITNFLVKDRLVCCFANLHDLTLWASFILMLGHDTVALALMAYPTIKGYTRPYQRTVLVERIHVEGVLFYVYFVVVDLVTVIIEVALPNSVFLFSMGVRFLRSMLACRVVLHIREYSSLSVNGSTVDRTQMSELRFE